MLGIVCHPMFTAFLLEQKVPTPPRPPNHHRNIFNLQRNNIDVLHITLTGPTPPPTPIITVTSST